ncbi:cellular nucleic acid-binding protein homolog [Lathyrus oleraceus]|uniref:cellular nucleic acid-binding protein homolog n=1 Tax=Pisum sativum TaxID=3888 RepID=UPI0021CEF5D8|nr:cellular nucleic acid-binding protein homolog [Pisum sativum]
MACTDAQQVLYGTCMFTEEAEYLWDNARQRFQDIIRVNINQNNNNGKIQSGGGVANAIKRFKCGVLGHRASECTAVTCYKCGKVRHKANECKSARLDCYNCRETGHISTNCQKPKKTQDVKVGGKVYALSGVEASKSDNLI